MVIVIIIADELSKNKEKNKYISLFGVRLVAARRWFDYIWSLLYGNLSLLVRAYSKLYIYGIYMCRGRESKYGVTRSMFVFIHSISAQIIVQRALTLQVNSFSRKHFWLRHSMIFGMRRNTWTMLGRDSRWSEIGSLRRKCAAALFLASTSIRVSLFIL